MIGEGADDGMNREELEIVTLSLSQEEEPTYLLAGRHPSYYIVLVIYYASS